MPLAFSAKKNDCGNRSDKEITGKLMIKIKILKTENEIRENLGNSEELKKRWKYRKNHNGNSGACEKLGDTGKLRKATTNQEYTNNDIKFTTLFQKHITIPITSL